jgi:hypothetical protein
VSSASSNILVAFLTLVTLFALTGYQVTSEAAAVRLLGRLGASLIELDRWLPAHREDIELLAGDRPDQPLVLDELPIEVAIPPEAVLDAPDSMLRATIAEAMGRRLYEDGYLAIEAESGADNLNLTEPLRWSIDALERSAHTFWTIVVIIAALALAAVCAGHLWLRQSPLPGLVAGSAIAAVFAIAAWLVTGGIASSVSGSLNQEIAEVVRDGVWVGVRNTLGATAIGLGGLYVLSIRFGRAEEDRWYEWDDLDETLEREELELEPEERLGPGTLAPRSVEAEALEPEREPQQIPPY